MLRSPDYAGIISLLTVIHYFPHMKNISEPLFFQVFILNAAFDVSIKLILLWLTSKIKRNLISSLKAMARRVENKFRL